jgi:hypothetical protein
VGSASCAPLHSNDRTWLEYSSMDMNGGTRRVMKKVIVVIKGLFVRARVDLSNKEVVDWYVF